MQADSFPERIGTMMHMAPPTTAPPRQVPRRFAHRGLSHTSSLEQKWLDIRFSGITPRHFHQDGIAVFSACNFKPPANFNDVWHVFDTKDQVLEDLVLSMVRFAAILLLADPTKPSQVTRIMEISNEINDIFMNGNVDGPPIFWVPHTTLPDRRILTGLDVNLYDEVMNQGVDDIISDEPKGIMLALAVRGKMNKQFQLTNHMEKILTKRREMNAKFRFLEESIDNIMWQYLRLRLQTGIPPINPEWTDGIPQEIEGLHRGPERGSGSSGTVYALLDEGQIPSGQVVKCISKKKITSITGLKSIKHQTDLMKLLSNAMAHPNITKFYDVFHSSSHILLLLEDGGDMNLFGRLVKRAKHLKGEDLEGGDLPLNKVVQLVKQSTSALAHLHACEIAHRDIKPENMCIQESGEDITLKVCDFDVAASCTQFQESSNVCGTFPFTAPEIYLEDSFRPFPADVWSLGSMQCEILCGLHFLERFLRLKWCRTRYEEQRRQNGLKVCDLDTAGFLTGKIKDVFAGPGAVRKVLETHVLEEVQPLQGPFGDLLDCMLLSEASRRSTSAQLSKLSQTTLNAGHTDEQTPAVEELC